jgi:hypothetical protein
LPPCSYAPARPFFKKNEAPPANDDDTSSLVLVCSLLFASTDCSSLHAFTNTTAHFNCYLIMSPATSLAAVAVASMVRGGARKPMPPPPSPQEATYDAFMKLNEPLRFFISGNIGNVIFFYTERLTFYLLNKMDGLPSAIKEYIDSVSFFIAYLVQVVPQHWLHAFLVYGLDTIDTRQKYFTTLFGCYSA